MEPTLIVCSHGTHSTAGRAAISAVIDDVRRLLPDVRVEETFVDVQYPQVDEVVERWTGRGTAVVVPLLLSAGFHTKVDIARAVGAHPGLAVATPALGPHDLLVPLLVDRLGDIGLRAGDAVVLAAAGSSEAAAADAVGAVAASLAQRIGRPVSTGFASGAGPRIAAAVAEARAAGATRVVLASYVLAPGFFADVISRAGVDAATAPLAPDGRIAAIVAERYLAAVEELQPLPSR